jgi:hypothetical protein
MVSITMICTRLARGECIMISLMRSSSWGGANTSSFSHDPVLLWCLPWLIRHEWYGTSSAE